MGNPISDQLKTGTIGELLVQTRLLQFDVQAAPPLKDSGNDLIAVRGEVFKGIQVKTTTQQDLRLDDLPKHYHIVAYVDLRGKGRDLYLDQSRVYLIPRAAIEKGKVRKNLEQFSISQELVDQLFREV